MRQYAAALEGVAARKANIGADRWASGSLGSIIAAYLDGSPESSSPFKALALATRQMRRRMLDRWRAEHGQLPLFRESRGLRVMLLTRQHVQVMVNKKAAILVTHFGKAYTAAGFGNWFRALADAAGCPGLSAHGLRKATATRLAEIGCDDKEIAAVLGHRSGAVASIYTRAADQKLLARSAMRKLVEAGK